MGGERLPVHDRGDVLIQAMLMLAGGGEACADLERLRSQASSFGAVPSDSTRYRTFRSITAETRLERGNRWPRSVPAWTPASATTGNATVVLDVDSSLYQIHSENKEEAAPNYKGGNGPRPIYCFADATGETPLGVQSRPGDTGADSSPITSRCSMRRSNSCQLCSPPATV